MVWAALDYVHSVAMIMSRQDPKSLSPDPDPRDAANIQATFSLEMADFMESEGLSYSSSDVLSLQEQIAVSSTDDIFGDTSHINEGLISDLLIDLSSNTMDTGIVCSVPGSSTTTVQTSRPASTISDTTWSSASQGSLKALSDFEGANSPTPQVATSVLSGSISLINTRVKPENLVPVSTQSAIFVPESPVSPFEKESQKLQEPRSQSASTSTADEEEHWVLPPKRRPGRKPSRLGHPKRPAKAEEKGSMEYLLKRARNNIAIRKCREKARMKQEETEKRLEALESENSLLKKENSDLRKTVESLKKEVQLLKKR